MKFKNIHSVIPSPEGVALLWKICVVAYYYDVQVELSVTLYGDRTILRLVARMKALFCITVPTGTYLRAKESNQLRLWLWYLCLYKVTSKVRLLASSVLSSKISMRYFYRCMNSTSLLDIEYWIFFSYTVMFLARFYCVSVLFIYVALNKFFFFFHSLS